MTAARERIPPEAVPEGTVIWTISGTAIVRSVEWLTTSNRWRFTLHDSSTITFLDCEGVPLPSKADLKAAAS